MVVYFFHLEKIMILYQTGVQIYFQINYDHFEKKGLIKGTIWSCY